MLIKLDIISYFTQIHSSYLQHSFFQKLLDEKIINLNLHSIITLSKEYNVDNDDKPYGHNTGMLLNISLIDQIILNKVKHHIDHHTIIIHPSPSGYSFNQEMVTQISQYTNFVFICSRYEGIDCRIIKKFNILELCIGDYILFDGDTAAMVIYNAIIRDKFVKKKAKINESFNNYLLEYDQFTGPRSYNQYIVPPVLYSGNHKQIKHWQHINSVQKTIEKRPDLYNKYISKINLEQKNKKK